MPATHQVLQGNVAQGVEVFFHDLQQNIVLAFKVLVDGGFTHPCLAGNGFYFSIPEAFFGEDIAGCLENAVATFQIFGHGLDRSGSVSEFQLASIAC